MICTTRSHVILFMDKFLKLGSIDYISGIEVRGSLLNVVLHEQLEIDDHARRSRCSGSFDWRQIARM